MAEPKIAFRASQTDVALSALKTLQGRYGIIAETDADVVVALGGDGFMLETLSDPTTDGRA
ncbi:MAG: NAD kinase, partial [Pseudomonadota bacterium]